MSNYPTTNILLFSSSALYKSYMLLNQVSRTALHLRSSSRLSLYTNFTFSTLLRQQQQQQQQQPVRSASLIFSPTIHQRAFSVAQSAFSETTSTPKVVESTNSPKVMSEENQDQQQQQQQQHKPMLGLPAPGDVQQDDGATNIEVNGQDVKLDALGPVVVNEDGTMSRINNWAEMAEIEKDNVRRILLKRNAARLTKLRAAQAAAIAAAEAQGGSL